MNAGSEGSMRHLVAPFKLTSTLQPKNLFHDRQLRDQAGGTYAAFIKLMGGSSGIQMDSSAPMVPA
jgi:hypothetical protein